MKRLAIGLSILLAATAAAWADDTADPMANFYGNTVVVVDANGVESHTHYNADHTFDGVAPAFNYRYKGTWEITADGQLCHTFDPPLPGKTNPQCNPIAPVAVGGNWTSADGGHGSLVQGLN